jgi:hypothetical protein
LQPGFIVPSGAWRFRQTIPHPGRHARRLLGQGPRHHLIGAQAFETFTKLV